MPCNIDAATVWSNCVYFFKGEKAWMWHYNKEQLIKGPISISMLNDKWNIENDIDAAVKWTLNKRVYIFKRLKYQRLHENENIEDPVHVDDSWRGLVGSALFPDCACDCTDGLNRIHWTFEKMDFAVELGYTKLLQESEVAKHVIDMRNENLQIQNEFTVFKDIVETELFIHSAGIALVTGTKFKTSIPYSINEKRRISS